MITRKLNHLKKNIDAMIIIKKKLETQEKWGTILFQTKQTLKFGFKFSKSQYSFDLLINKIFKTF